MNELNAIPKLLGKILRRYHLVLFVIAVVGSMSIVILMINQSLQASTDTSDISTQTTITFDQKTIDRVNALQPTQSQQPLTLPSNQRTNPFVE